MEQSANPRYEISAHAVDMFRARVRSGATWDEVRADFNRPGTVEVPEAWVRDVKTVYALNRTPRLEAPGHRKYFLQADREGIWVIVRHSNGDPNLWKIVTVEPVPFYVRQRVLKDYPLEPEPSEDAYESVVVDEDTTSVVLSPDASKRWRPFRKEVSAEGLLSLPRQDASPDGRRWRITLPSGESLFLARRTVVKTIVHITDAEPDSSQTPQEDATLPGPASDDSKPRS